MKKQNYKYNINFEKKNKICNECMNFIKLNGYKGCIHRDIDGEYCGTLEDCKHARQLNACKYISNKLQERLKNMDGDGNEQGKK